MRYRTYAPSRQAARLIPMRNGTIALESPYDAGLVASLKAAIPHSDRKWDRGQKLWLVAAQHAQTLADLCERHLGERPQVPQVTVSTAHTTQVLQVKYLGAAKDRGGGEQTAFGWVGGGWGAIFPLAVLQEWFCVETKPGEAPTLYATLGVPKTVDTAKLKSAYKRAARQWHPDVCSDPGAGEQFRAIQRAYDALSDPFKRRKYDAGLQLAGTVKQTDQDLAKSAYGWRPPLRCGYILVEGQETLGRFVVSKILQWEDIVNSAGQTLVTSWRYGDDTFQERWV